MGESDSPKQAQSQSKISHSYPTHANAINGGTEEEFLSVIFSLPLNG